MNEGLTRRQFLSATGVIGTGILLDSCTAPLTTITPKPATQPAEQYIFQPTPQPIETRQWIESVRQRILSFTIEDFQDEQRRNEFIQELANSYVKLSGTSRLTAEQMVLPQHLFLAQTHKAFVADYNSRNPGQNLPDKMLSTAFTNTPDRRVTLDMEGFVKMRTFKQDHVGIALASILLHEWGHADITDRTEGALINNPESEYVQEYEGKKMIWEKYRGAAVHSGKFEQLIRFNEIVNEAIMVMRMRTQLGLNPMDSSYTPIGTDFFVPLMHKLGIGADELYIYYSTSDFEGLTRRIGNALPGDKDVLIKGIHFAFSVNSENPKYILDTGVFDVYPDIYPNPEGR